MPSSQVVPDQVDVAFDDERAVASAGLLLSATLAERLGIEQAENVNAWWPHLARRKWPHPLVVCV
jgi:hypothetical protein